MLESLPLDIQHFIQAQVSSGKYSSEAEVVVQAVQLLRQRDDDYCRLQAEIQRRFAAVDAGDYIELNGDEDLADFFAEIKQEVDDELARERGGPK
jgi:putative addiction module CopG family antidote